MKIKQLFLASVATTTLFSGGVQLLDSNFSGYSALAAENKATDSSVKALYERYSKPYINHLKEENKNWSAVSAPRNKNQVRILVEGFYTKGTGVERKHAHVTLPKGEITLKELDHIVRYAAVNFGLYQSGKPTRGEMLAFRTDKDRYTLELHKPLQPHRENVKINTEDLVLVAFHIQE
ncbi:exotoxin beta-grasp domain-containing protein [Staphylococcus lutrae]|uniref:Staphylococcal/Streptococcal toxin beta-grasp domain-containing protein n=1 Tax=Staphylococcus lutrae TaxID=155085 RepID=A0AAC9RU82_9STAP|nr:hypothetical protein [Staphylococcus lutrae]ARJ50830.1 hypothetical protein B5P37_05595 [Staphylococcus lutrae]PNZ36814.1 enterotoxin [Staphylococcus lutrae]